jgi:hypothetical protein
MSPDEWAKKIRDLIDEAEIDLINFGSQWYFEYRDASFVLQQYCNNLATDEYVEVW